MENETIEIKQNRFKKILKNKRVVIISLIIIILVILGANRLNNNEENNNEENEIIKNVNIITIGNEENGNTIEAVGIAKAETKIDVTALTGGVVKNIFFEIGDIVPKNKILASLNDRATLTNLLNARTDFSNRLNNLNVINNLSEESIRQAELSVESAEEAIALAEINLKTSQDNLVSAKALKEKNNNDTKNNAVISFGGYLNTINSTLDQVNYIIKAEGNAQLDGIANTLGINNPGSITTATSDYFLLKTSFNELSQMNTSVTNISEAISKINLALNQTKILVDDTIVVLENTIESDSISETTITTQKNSFYNLRTTVVSAQASSESTLQALDNLELNYNQEITALENAVSAAENQLVSAKTNYNNALVSQESTTQSKEQNLISAQTSLDSVRGQLNLAESQAADLNVKTPINGQITKKYIELGTEVNPGQKIAELSQTDLLIIEIDLSIDDISRIKAGQEVNINNDLKGSVNKIYPTADTTSKKIKVEILFDNKDKSLIAESFVNVSIPLTDNGNSSIMIPLKSIHITPTENFVFLVEDGKAKKAQVKNGRIEDDKIEIISGLNNGDKLIIEGTKNIEDGDSINITE